MKKIALLSFYSIYSSKGVEKFLRIIFEGLEKDFNIDVFSMSHTKSKHKETKHEYYVPNLNGLGYFLYIIYIGFIIYFRKRNYDFIICNNINGFIICLLNKIGLWNNDIPIITLCHNVKKSYYDAIKHNRYSIPQRIMLYVDYICYNYSDIVVATSFGVKQQLLDSYNVPEKNIKTIINTLPLQDGKKMNFIDKKKRIVFVSGDHQRKGIEVIQELGQILEREKSEIIISIIGPKLENNICENIISDGYIDNKLLLDYVAESLLFILPSKNEGLPLSLLESVSVGTPFIASRECNVEMMHNIAGKVIENSITEYYYDAMNEILANYKVFQENGINYMKVNSVGKMLHEYKTLFL